jgi:hypothetical protein
MYVYIQLIAAVCSSRSNIDFADTAFLVKKLGPGRE